MSLIAGAALDHLGAKRTVPVGVAILGIGCLLFSLPSVFDGNVGRLPQGAGSAFTFTGAPFTWPRTASLRATLQRQLEPRNVSKC